jgi:glycosyltransferase involved in cell wall biosynthesis
MIVATLGRSRELDDLLRSLAAQQRRDLEIIIVDQNADDRLAPIVCNWTNHLRITRVRAESRGVCRARNIGAAHARGEWLLFPDDDCWYPDTFLSELDKLRSEHPAAFYSGRAVNAQGHTIMGDFRSVPGAIDRDAIWTTLIEWMMVVRRDAFEAVGGFDEKLGPGAGTPWGAYEAQDLALKLLTAGYAGYYDPALAGHHPDERSDRASAASIAKLRAYNVGMGYVMRKHGYRFLVYLPRLLRPLAGVAVYALTGRLMMARRSWGILSGRWSGWTSAPVPESSRT